VTADQALAVTLVTTSDCHLCEHARTVLDRLRSALPMEVAEVSWNSDHGRLLIQADGVPFPPALYVGRSLVGYGRLSERALRRRLQEVRS